MEEIILKGVFQEEDIRKHHAGENRLKDVIFQIVFIKICRQWLTSHYTLHLIQSKLKDFRRLLKEWLWEIPELLPPAETSFTECLRSQTLPYLPELQGNGRNSVKEGLA